MTDEGTWKKLTNSRQGAQPPVQQKIKMYSQGGGISCLTRTATTPTSPMARAPPIQHKERWHGGWAVDGDALRYDFGVSFAEKPSRWTKNMTTGGGPGAGIQHRQNQNRWFQNRDLQGSMCWSTTILSPIIAGPCIQETGLRKRCRVRGYRRSKTADVEYGIGNF